MCLLFPVLTQSLALNAVHLPPVAMFYISQCYHQDHLCCCDSLHAQDPFSMVPAAKSLANYSTSFPTVQPRRLPGEGGQKYHLYTPWNPVADNTR